MPNLPFQPRSAGRNFFNRDEVEIFAPDNFVELCWVKQGRVEIEVNGTRIPLSAGDCVFRMPFDVRYKRALANETIVWWATIDGEGAADFIYSFGYPRAALNAGPCPEELFGKIVRGLFARDPNAPRRLFPLYAELFLLAGGSCKEPRSAGNDLVEECLYQCNTRYSESGFNINTLADALGVHRTTIARVMREAIKESPLEYLTSLRLERGLDLLASTNNSIQDITRQIGFRQSCYFCRLVRNHTGMSPLKYRRCRRQQ